MSSTTRDFLRCFKFMHTLSGTLLICLGGSGFLFAGRWEIVKTAADGGRCSELANCSWSRDGSIRWRLHRRYSTSASALTQFANSRSLYPPF